MLLGVSMCECVCVCVCVCVSVCECVCVCVCVFWGVVLCYVMLCCNVCFQCALAFFFSGFNCNDIRIKEKKNGM